MHSDRRFGSGGVRNKVIAGAWHHYCFRTKCSNFLEDLLVSHDATYVAFCGLALGFIVLLLMWRCSRHGAVACGVAPPVILLILFAGRTDREKRNVESRQAVHLHRCWNVSRCTNSFSVYVHGLSGRQARTPAVWQPPSGVELAPSPQSACAVIVPLGSFRFTVNNDGVPQLAGWNGGRNHVIVDDSDDGIDAAERKYVYGCALIAQSHMDLDRFVPDFDISLPLPLPRAGSAAALERISAFSERRHWLTFRGTFVADDGEGQQRRKLLALGHGGGDGIEVWLQCTRFGRTRSSSKSCERLEREFRSGAPSYAELLNTTFALVPAGRQPASYRLAEVMAAGAIPVFVSGDLRTSSPYVRPFGELIDWPSISLHFSWEAVPDIPSVLRKLSPAKVAAMQRGVRSAWREYLHPQMASRTFYSLLRMRARALVR